MYCCATFDILKAILLQRGDAMTAMWQQIKQHPVALGITGSIFVLAIVLVIVVVWFNGTGFDGYTQVTTAQTISGPSAGTVVRTEVYQPGKALWDWLQLLIIPAVLVVGGFLLNYTINRNEQKATQLRDQTERDIAMDNQREDLLQAYLSKMSDLLLKERLRYSDFDDEVRHIARSYTLTVLRRLDPIRKGSLLLFLYESRLIYRPGGMYSQEGEIILLGDADLSYSDLNHANLHEINLMGADLRNANLSHSILQRAELMEANLSMANLSGVFLGEADLLTTNLSHANLNDANLGQAFLKEANLRNANLSGASLNGADLTEADLTEAEVTSEQLNEAKSLKGATMPDGTKHE
jgi:uncharacterized protein YjbI with pentapeptide repeats